MLNCYLVRSFPVAWPVELSRYLYSACCSSNCKDVQTAVLEAKSIPEASSELVHFHQSFCVPVHRLKLWSVLSRSGKSEFQR